MVRLLASSRAPRTRALLHEGHLRLEGVADGARYLVGREADRRRARDIEGPLREVDARSVARRAAPPGGGLWEPRLVRARYACGHKSEVRERDRRSRNARRGT